MARKNYYWGREKVYVIRKADYDRYYVKCEDGSYAYVPKSMLSKVPK